MQIDYTHNSIVAETVSAAFRRDFEGTLMPQLHDVYGDALRGVQFYESYLDDGFVYNGAWYYPLTLLFQNSRKTQWICWPFPAPGTFIDGNPYAYTGDAPLAFSPVQDVPPAFENALAGRNRYADGNTVPTRVCVSETSESLLKVHFSQTFIDEMARQLTYQIEKTAAVTGVSQSGMTLKIVFSDKTFMEHICGKITYRRLLMTDGGRTVRDFWICWERVGEGERFTMRDAASAQTVRFSLCEDVPRAVREREYRYLLAENPEKNKTAIAKRALTGWRDIPKRLVKRGALVAFGEPRSAAEIARCNRLEKTAPLAREKMPPVEPPHASTAAPDELMLKLAQVLEKPMPDVVAETEKQEAIEREVERRFAAREAVLREEISQKIREDMDREERMRLAEQNRFAAQEAERQAAAKRQSGYDEIGATAKQAQNRYDEVTPDLRPSEERILRETAGVEDAPEEPMPQREDLPAFALAEATAPAETAPAPDTEETADRRLRLYFSRPAGEDIETALNAVTDESLSYLGIEGVEIRIRRTGETEAEIRLCRFPAGQNDRLVYIINVLGHSKLGICRILLD